ncbi:MULTISPECIES: phage tail protein [Methylobacterium]|uniref:phage tail protein n=1 Tax=Methylobacterium TaxID=407 RepID=UPI0013E9D8AD|nr:phage tail protein [Methylobacterium sp. DB0501]NGM38183.1 tail fiber protein [Methylobacterium sp. DB0501]
MDAYISMIMLWSGSIIPSKWMPCEGQELNVWDHYALFNLIYTTYGGDGEKTFRLPDLRDKVPEGFDKQMKYIICVDGYFPQ